MAMAMIKIMDMISIVGTIKIKEHRKCNQGVGNGSEGCESGHSG